MLFLLNSSNGDKTDVIEISKSCMQDMVLGSAQRLSELYDKAIKTRPETNSTLVLLFS